MLSQNPLIDSNPSDTIDNLSMLLEMLCIALSNDDEVHEGYVLIVKTAFSASKSLQNKNLKEAGVTQAGTQKV